MNEEAKLIPYGVTDFPSIIRNNYYYVDKTHYINNIERTASFFFFVRPRRFGKSLFINMLEAYYDCTMKDEFDELFGELYVGKHPTPNRNNYLVLHMDFSGISADPDRMVASFDRYCTDILKFFVRKYAALFPTETLLQELDREDPAANKMAKVCMALQLAGLKMYLIMDDS